MNHLTIIKHFMHYITSCLKSNIIIQIQIFETIHETESRKNNNRTIETICQSDNYQDNVFGLSYNMQTKVLYLNQ